MFGASSNHYDMVIGTFAGVLCLYYGNFASKASSDGSLTVGDNGKY